MATYSNILAWRIPWTEEPGKLQPMELQRVGQDLATNTLRCLNWPDVSHLAHFPVEDVPQVGNVLEDGHITANTTISKQKNKHIQVSAGKGSLCWKYRVDA